MGLSIMVRYEGFPLTEIFEVPGQFLKLYFCLFIEFISWHNQLTFDSLRSIQGNDNLNIETQINDNR